MMFINREKKVCMSIEELNLWTMFPTPEIAQMKEVHNQKNSPVIVVRTYQRTIEADVDGMRNYFGNFFCIALGLKGNSWSSAMITSMN